MKLTRKEVESRLTAAWGKQAHLVAYDLWGSTTYAATDHGEHWMPLQASYRKGRQVFKLLNMDWPSRDNGAWAEAVTKAADLARDYFLNQRNMPALKRLPRAQVLAEARNWERQGDGHDTWLMRSTTGAGAVYEVNDRCTCPDWLYNGVPGGWCKHRLARALARRAERFLQGEQRAGRDHPAPASMKASVESEADSTTGSAVCQVRRVDVVVAYEASEGNCLVHMNANGKLVSFNADGHEVTPPVQTMPQIYAWLQAHGYVPDCFKWLDWEHGLRHRQQTYVLDGDRSLKVTYTKTCKRCGGRLAVIFGELTCVNGCHRHQRK